MRQLIFVLGLVVAFVLWGALPGQTQGLGSLLPGSTAQSDTPEESLADTLRKAT